MMANHIIQKSLIDLERYKQWFQKASDVLGPFENAKQPNESEWSFVEIIEHLQIPEVRLLEGIKTAGSTPMPKLTIKNKIARKVVTFILRNGIKVPTPSERVIPKGGKTAIDLFLQWDELRTKMHIALSALNEEQLNSFAFDHPRAGPLNVTEGLIMGVNHLQYHFIRAKKVFPKLKQIDF